MGIASFALGAAAQKYYDSLRLITQQPLQTTKSPVEDGAGTENRVDVAPIRFDQEPLWAYGFDTPPLPGEKAFPQNPPTRDLRPNEDPIEQTKPRRLAGSRAVYSLVDVRDGQHVIDWFPSDHPPMPAVIQHWIRVVETDLVPKTRIVGNLFLPLEKVKTEPIAGRIIEVPENEEQSETYRNPHSGFVAYVPIGSLKKGKDLVTTGGARVVGNEFVQGKTTPCITCHGLDLMGAADAAIPPIAGRSPSYMVRQMWDVQQGTRNSEPPNLMKLIVANLTKEDMVAIAAYVASRRPPRVPAATKLTTSLQ